MAEKEDGDARVESVSSRRIDFPLQTDPSGKMISTPECAVCLQTCVHPVKLPCSHIFCYLCVKGAAIQSKRCALCRTEIPANFLSHPTLVDNLVINEEIESEDKHAWFYEGRNGWWQYDERTSAELEDKYKQNDKMFDLLIAGSLYVIDFNNMLQSRRNDNTRRRRIKRDSTAIQKKGIAGLRLGINSSTPRENEPEGQEVDSQISVPAVPSNSSQQPQTTQIPVIYTSDNTHQSQNSNLDTTGSRGSTDNASISNTRTTNGRPIRVNVNRTRILDSQTGHNNGISETNFVSVSSSDTVSQVTPNNTPRSPTESDETVSNLSSDVHSLHLNQQNIRSRTPRQGHIRRRCPTEADNV